MTARGAAGAVAQTTAHAGAIQARHISPPAAGWYGPVGHLIPAAPCRIADIGAATGRDARWFAALGHQGTPVEPVAAFPDAGRGCDDRVAWVEDALPDLPRLAALDGRFDLVTLSAVWHHVAPGERGRAAAALAGLTAPGGTVLVALRHGPVPKGLPLHAVDADATASDFAAAGLSEVFRGPVGTFSRDAGVSWTWLALRAAGGTE